MMRELWELADEIAASIPDEDWEKVPVDLARNLDHYLYGDPPACEEGRDEPS
jgi:hypothetical protein